ncbi:MAG: hypothetical protein ABJN69_16825 [Hellea sp.]
MTAATQALIALPHASDGNIRPLVEAELARVRAHALFKDTTRMKRFLSYVVTEALEGREDRLKGYAIGLEVFDRADDFDPQADTIVRVQAGQLRRRLDLYYASDGKDAPVRILIPKGRYAPVFEVRCEAPRLESKDERSTVVGIEKMNRPGIVVLTFQNLAADNDTKYFAEGVTAEVVNALVQFRYMRIVARTASVMDDGKASSNLSEIAKAYNVQFALAGNVRRAGKLVRVSVNLISVQTGEHVYSKIFDREYTPENLFEIQEEIASHVAASVAAPFGAINRYNRRAPIGRLSSMKAYEALLKFYEMSISPTASKAEGLLSEFEKIIIDTPRFSSAWAVISLLNTLLVTLQIPSSNPETRLKTALSTARRAVEIDPENALAFNALFQANFHSGNFDIADEVAAKSIALNPNDYNMLAYYAIALASRGNVENALSFQSAALELVARPPLWFHTSSLICKFQDQDFVTVINTVGEITPDSPVAIQVLGLSSMGHLSMTEQAQDFIKKSLSANPDYAKHVYLTMMYFHPNPEFKRLILEGWRKAGLDIPSL